MVLGAVAPGCRHEPRYDSRLTAADSLLRDDPDSALAMLEALVPDSSVARGDEGGGIDFSDADSAYHALLLTQARYKCYVTATSDSDINLALSYFCAHPTDREKLTRAYIYKGAVMDELGHPDSAMFYYKTAEANAAPDDYFNLGYVKMRMGALYNSYYTMDGQETSKYEDALENFRLAKDSVHILVCLNNLGCMYRESCPDRADSLLMEASILARQLQDTARIVYNDLSLIVLDYYQGRYEKAQKLIWEVNNYGIEELDYKMYFKAVCVYARLGILDTAQIYLDLARKNFSGDKALYEMHYLKSLSDLALAKGDTLTSLRLENKSERIEDSLKSNEQKFEILRIEDSHDKISMNDARLNHKKTISSYQWIIVFVIILLVLSVFYYFFRMHHYDRLISGLKKDIKNQSVDMKKLRNNFEHLKINDKNLKSLITSHIDMMQQMIEECYHSPHGPLAKSIRRIVKFQEDNKDIWNDLYQYLDTECNNIMSVTVERFPQLSDKDLLVIALTCLEYSCAQIAIVLDYSSSAGISTIRKRIATKMNLECSLGEYIEQFKTAHEEHP